MIAEVWGISLIRDEADVLPATLGRMAEQVDHLLIADNGSVDGSGDIARELGADVIHDSNPAHYQADKVSGLALMAADRGAAWVVPFDADEAWSAVDGTIAEQLRGLPDWALVAEAALYNHFATAEDPEVEDPVERLGWRDPGASGLPKVAVRPFAHGNPVRIHDGNHGANYGDTPAPPTVANLLSIRHFPYRSAEQFLRKVKNGAEALAATDLPEDVGAHWRQYGELLDAEGPQAVRAWWREHFYFENPRAAGLVFDPCP